MTLLPRKKMLYDENLPNADVKFKPPRDLKHGAPVVGFTPHRVSSGRKALGQLSAVSKKKNTEKVFFFFLKIDDIPLFYCA